jgi:hypothetical protein
MNDHQGNYYVNAARFSGAAPHQSQKANTNRRTPSVSPAPRAAATTHQSQIAPPPRQHVPAEIMRPPTGIPRCTPRGLTAEDLFKRSRRHAVETIVNEQVQLIDAQINVAHGAGFNQIVYTLPNTIDIAGMDKATAQTLIYSEILMVYADKGFTDVYIDPGEHSNIHVRWINGMDEDERRDRLRYIESRYLPKK